MNESTVKVWNTFLEEEEEKIKEAVRLLKELHSLPTWRVIKGRKLFNDYCFVVKSFRPMSELTTLK